MADGTTTNQSFVLPEVGASEDTWGTKLIANWSALDTLIGGVNATEVAILDGATVTTAELNILDGVTATASELNALDGITATVSELNILDGVTATAAELNILDGVTATAANLNLLAGATATGTGTLVFGTSPTITTPTLTSPVINTAVTGTALASTAEAEAGTATNKLMTPVTTAAAIAAATPSKTVRAMCGFNGTSATPISVEANGLNVTNVTKNGTGDYTINFTTALANVNYTVQAMSVDAGGDLNSSVQFHGASARAVGSVRLVNVDRGGNNQDSALITVTVIG